MLFTHIHLLGKQSRHPARGKRHWEDQAQRRVLTLRGKHSPLDKCRDNTTRMALARANNAGGIGTRQLSPRRAVLRCVCTIVRTIMILYPSYDHAL